MNGQEMVKRARALRPGLKILFMTGYDETDDPLEPDSGLIAKPFSIDALALQIGLMLKGESDGEGKGEGFFL